MALNRAKTAEFLADVPQEYVASLKSRRLGYLALVVALISTVFYLTKLPGLIFGICLPLAYIASLAFSGKQSVQYVFSARGVRLVSKTSAGLSSASAMNHWLDFETNRIACVGNSSWKGYPVLVFIYQKTGREQVVPMHRQDVEQAFIFCQNVVVSRSEPDE